MDAVDQIRLARPDVAEATPQEAVAIRASFELQVAEEPSRFRSLLKRFSGRQIVAVIAALLIVPAGAYAVVTQVIDDDRSDQLEQALKIVPPNREATQGAIEGCRQLQARGLESELCTQVLESVENGEGSFEPVP